MKAAVRSAVTGAVGYAVKGKGTAAVKAAKSAAAAATKSAPSVLPKIVAKAATPQEFTAGIKAALQSGGTAARDAYIAANTAPVVAAAEPVAVSVFVRLANYLDALSLPFAFGLGAAKAWKDSLSNRRQVWITTAFEQTEKELERQNQGIAHKVLGYWVPNNDDKSRQLFATLMKQYADYAQTKIT